jgi:hypothetical protein
MTTVTDLNRLREEEEMMVGPLLARAKLFRVRGQWDEAIAACTDILRRYPISVTACSLLGEIYEAQGRLEDAVQWYVMALERDPGSKSDRAGLDRVVAAQRAKQEPAVLKSLEVPVSTQKPMTEKTLEWFDRIFPPGDSRSIARMLYAVSGVIGGLLIVGAVIFYLFLQNRSRRDVPELPPPGGTVAALPTPTTPVVVEPLPRSSATPEPVASPTSAPAAGSTVAPSPMPPSIDDSKLIAYINRYANNLFLVQSLRRDTANAHLDLDLLVPVGETPEKSRELILQAAVFTVKLAAQTDTTLQTAMVRASMPSPLNPATPANVFTGELTISAIRDIDPRQLGYMGTLSRFARLQWDGPLSARGRITSLSSPGMTNIGSTMGNGGSRNGTRQP